MSYDGIGVSDTMLDSLTLQLREAELRRTDAERAHQVCNKNGIYVQQQKSNEQKKPSYQTGLDG